MYQVSFIWNVLNNELCTLCNNHIFYILVANESLRKSKKMRIITRVSATSCCFGHATTDTDTLWFKCTAYLPKIIDEDVTAWNGGWMEINFEARSKHNFRVLFIKSEDIVHHIYRCGKCYEEKNIYCIHVPRILSLQVYYVMDLWLISQCRRSR